VRGALRGHRAYTFEQERAVYGPVVDERVRVAVGGDDAASLADAIAELRP
jgi:hypothetical protein